MEYIWGLEYIELDGEILYQPENEESDVTITMNIYDNFFDEDFFNFEHDLICDTFFCELLEFSDNNSFDFFSCAITLDGCSITENSNYQSNYMMVYQDFFDGDEVFSPFTYSFNTEDEITYLTITNSIGNSATYSATTLSDVNFKETKLSIYPNPITNRLYIESNNAQIQQIEIFSLNGKRVLALNYQNKQNIEVSDLVNGIYFVKIHIENGSFTRSLVKN